MSAGSSLLDGVQGLLERTYAMRTGLAGVAPFVVGDAGYRLLYSPERPADLVAGSAADSARTLVRETAEGVRAAIYLPDGLVAALEAHPPQRGLSDANVDAFATLVEEVDHLLCIADRVAAGRQVSLFELELHANVSKALVLARFLAGRAARAIDPARRTWLRFHLFHKGEWAGRDAAEQSRYRDAARWALRMLDGLERLPEGATSRLAVLRRFHAAGPGGKIGLIEGLAAAAAS